VLKKQLLSILKKVVLLNIFVETMVKKKTVKKFHGILEQI